MNETVFEWNKASIAQVEDASRIHGKVYSHTLPLPKLSVRDMELRFSLKNLEEDISEGNRIFVLLEKNKAQIQAIIELFHSEKYPGLYYSKTPLQGGRSIMQILPDILGREVTPCREVALPIYEQEKRAPSRYMKKPFETLDGDIITMYATDVRSLVSL